MNIELKTKWVAALRSGKYQQTRRMLHRLEDDVDTDRGHCCLGVLCEILKEEGKIISQIQDDDKVCEYYGKEDVLSSSDIPTTILTEIGLSVNAETNLINMNDDEHKTFAEIADYIESNDL